MIPENEELKTPLPILIGEIAGLWTVASVGYYVVFPLAGIGLGYNDAPIEIALYYFLFAGITLFYFWRLFSGWVHSVRPIWTYLALSALCAAGLWGLLYAFATMPALQGAPFVPYTDILFASPWYFLPKSAEVLVQQLLIAVLVLELYARTRSLKRTMSAYAVTFGGAHVLLYVINGAPTEYASVMTIGAFVSSLIFPYLYVRVRRGFVYAYTIHLAFYVLLAMALHAWPPPGYIA